MAVGNNEIQVLWATASEKSVAATATELSDVFNFSATAFDAMVTLKADNATTPASGDTVDFFLLPSCGDPDGAGANEYPAGVNHGLYLARLDTYLVDPAIATVKIPVALAGKVCAKNNASANAIVVSACINEKTAS